MTTADSSGAVTVEGDLTQYDHLAENTDNGPEVGPDETPDQTPEYDGPEL